MVVFPTTKEDVALGADTEQDQAGQITKASTATKFIIDLSWLNHTQVLKKVKVAGTTLAVAVTYKGCAKWGRIQGATAGSNYTAVGARVGSVGAGGFSIGGGIEFLAGAYGYASDGLPAVEVVLMNGNIVNTTKTNQYKDLFWALKEAARTFFNTNDDLFSLMYLAASFFPADLANGLFALNTLLVTLRFDGQNRATQKPVNATFRRIIITLDYLANGTVLLNRYVADIAAAGDMPASSIWTPQYMYPILNSNLPKSDADTAWPHARAGHQTLFSPAWSNVVDDVIMKGVNWKLNGKKFGKHIYDYPNYISPGVKAKRVWGENVKRLIQVKQ
ncbi:hypothetical protein B9Z65_7146 [Elsinoe australis]|uniref:FAD-binding PCMH-type domain-containing protein n=1 Tax=Elsinoe australis TaxID=40998 RepID=A0A2P7Z5X1_9PEZI|nr:hypothetical protein B9Z65_7146 [Elsinoe australis]